MERDRRRVRPPAAVAVAVGAGVADRAVAGVVDRAAGAVADRAAVTVAVVVRAVAGGRAVAAGIRGAIAVTAAT